jgi:hypothetical protein
METYALGDSSAFEGLYRIASAVLVLTEIDAGSTASGGISANHFREDA